MILSLTGILSVQYKGHSGPVDIFYYKHDSERACNFNCWSVVFQSSSGFNGYSRF